MRFVALVFILSVASTGNADESMKTCLQDGYRSLGHHSIAAAVIDGQKTDIVLFGAATKEQLFEVGSITKTFTANLLAQFVLERQLKLSDPIPSVYQKEGSIITYENLTTHLRGSLADSSRTFRLSTD